MATAMFRTDDGIHKMSVLLFPGQPAARRAVAASDALSSFPKINTAGELFCSLYVAAPRHDRLQLTALGRQRWSASSTTPILRATGI